MCGEIAAWLYRFSVRPLDDPDCENFGDGYLYASPLSSHENAAHLLVKMGILESVIGRDTVWGPFRLRIPEDQIRQFVSESSDATITTEGFLMVFLGMCAHFFTMYDQETEFYPTKCNVGGGLLVHLTENGYVAEDQSGYSWTDKMKPILVAGGVWSTDSSQAPNEFEM